MHLYELPLSLYSVKVRLALALKGLDIERREPPGGYRSDAYRAIVPSATIPALIDGDLVLPESDAIVAYLDECFPERLAIPGTPKERARARMLTRLIDLRLEAKIRLLFPQVAPANRNEEIVDSVLYAANQAAELIEDMLDPSGPFAAGPTPSLADCALLATFSWHDAIWPALGEPVQHGPRTERALAAGKAEPRLGPVIAAYAPLVEDWVLARVSLAQRQ